MENNIGIDVGASKIAAGLIDPDGKILKEIKIPTEAKKGAERVVENIIKSVSLVAGKTLSSKIGIGIAGQVDYRTGIVIFSPNMKGFIDFPLRTVLLSRLGRKIEVKIDNDANCFALAENRIGEGKSFDNIVGLTIGTGIGSGVICHRQLYHGRSFASEIGHMKIENHGPKCSCGNKGCLEAYCSGWAIAKRYYEFTKCKKMPSDIEKEAKNDPKGVAYKIYKEAGKYLGVGLANIIDIFDPEAIVVGGGLGDSELLFKFGLPEMRKRMFLKKPQTVIKRSKLGNKTAMIGAAFLFA